ncbi:hypothetical protein GFY24_24590 [Nocardia sp. SYP-A9097]|uniref:hypothetical protein n=1 Tax=Nocardia sp. SYP-A9097 TaxID=2663237 RepID=UPI00129C0B78|nr:hypothetical protein [Nocardia sp. SYP-A9097]MRH90580.1 hypothetical protein [Nocardia sp. SYP-A9097]
MRCARGDLAGAVVEQFAQLVREGAAGAEALGVEFAFVLAARAAVGGGEPSAIGAEEAAQPAAQRERHH